MSKKTKTPFPPYLSDSANGYEKKYIRKGYTLMRNKNYLSLSGNAVKLYDYMQLAAYPTNICEMPKLEYMKFFKSPDTFHKARNELIEKGFIEIAENNANLRKPNVYRLIEKWKQI